MDIQMKEIITNGYNCDLIKSKRNQTKEGNNEGIKLYKKNQITNLKANIHAEWM